ncbi:MAG: FtsH protease activity modulator HflK [Bacteroidota bacterium]|nr:FtsH protease activity modulator HflK [Bacteroidota bacterium]
MNNNQFPDFEIPESYLIILRKAARNIKLIVFAIIILIIAFGAFFQIEPEELGVITRYGKYSRTVEPGLNLKIPFLEKLYKIPVERQQKQEFGFLTTSAGVQSSFSKTDTKGESLMLTGDLNLADVEWVVQYRIDSPYNFLFKVRNPENTLRDISEAAMRQIVGDRTVNEVLTVGRTEVADKAQVLIQKLITEYSLGIKVDQVVLQDVNPPDQVKAAFNAVNQAQQEKETLINEARSGYNKVIPKARGQAKETIQKAEGYALERVNNAQGEVARFDDLYKEYIKAPEVTRRRIYLETMSKVLPQLGQKIITDEGGNNVLPLLQMKMQNEQTTKTTKDN